MANAKTNPRTYEVLGIVDEIPAVQRGILTNPELEAVKAAARANPGRWVEFASDCANPSSLGGNGFKFVQRSGRTFVTYNPNTNGTNQETK